MTDPEVLAIKQQHFSAIQQRHVLLLVQADYGYEVRYWMPDGVAPTSAYDTPHEAVARAMQLLGIAAPVAPQSWPEVFQIGSGGKPPKPEARERNDDTGEM